jgi:BMFP domain-containing protein YqiC
MNRSLKEEYEYQTHRLTVIGMREEIEHLKQRIIELEKEVAFLRGTSAVDDVWHWIDGPLI